MFDIIKIRKGDDERPRFPLYYWRRLLRALLDDVARPSAKNKSDTDFQALFTRRCSRKTRHYIDEYIGLADDISFHTASIAYHHELPRFSKNTTSHATLNFMPTIAHQLISDIICLIFDYRRNLIFFWLELLD